MGAAMVNREGMLDHMQYLLRRTLSADLVTRQLAEGIYEKLSAEGRILFSKQYGVYLSPCVVLAREAELVLACL